MEAADRTLDRVAARYAEDLAPAVPRVWKSGIEDLRTDLARMAATGGAERWRLGTAAFRIRLRTAGSRRATTRRAREEEAELAGRRPLARIDRPGGETYSQRHVAGDGSQDGQGSGEDSGVYRRREGAATDAVRAGGGEAAGEGRWNPDGLFYATQRGGYQQIGIAVSPRSRAFIAKLLHRLDAAIETGFLPPVPEKDACGICDYRAVCGPYEEQRAARTKNRQDERLDGLHEIRGFL